MGIAKEMWMESQERGWDSSDEFVCSNCVDDYALEAQIDGASNDDQNCTFCGATPAAEIDILTEAFVAGLWREHEDANTGVSYDSAEGGYQFLGSHWDTWDLVDHYGHVLPGEGLIECLRGIIHERTWVERDFAWRRRATVLRDAWSRFSEAVKYRTRYVIWLTEEADDHDERQYGEVPPGQVLYDIAGLLGELDLIRDLPVNAALWRVQTHEGVTISGGPTGSRLGTAPRDRAKQPNRMNPAGIPMFYGSEDSETAIAEVVRHLAAEHDHATVGRYCPSDPLKVVDFTGLRYVSMFDPELGHLHRQVAFLLEFVQEIQRPIEKGEELIDYVPTQVMTEFFLRVYRLSDEAGADIRGIRYPSAVNPSGVSLVVDIPNDHCVDSVPVDRDAQPYLVLDMDSVEVLVRSTAFQAI